MEAAINRHRAKLLVERYHFNMGLLMGEQGLGQGTVFLRDMPFLLGMSERGVGGGIGAP